MTRENIETVRACPDCVAYCANGPGEIDPATVERIRVGLARWGSFAEFFADIDPDSGVYVDEGFTRQPCDVCGLALGHDYVSGKLVYGGNA